MSPALGSSPFAHPSNHVKIIVVVRICRRPHQPLFFFYPKNAYHKGLPDIFKSSVQLCTQQAIHFSVFYRIWDEKKALFDTLPCIQLWSSLTVKKDETYNQRLVRHRSDEVQLKTRLTLVFSIELWLLLINSLRQKATKQQSKPYIRIRSLRAKGTSNSLLTLDWRLCLPYRSIKAKTAVHDRPSTEFVAEVLVHSFRTDRGCRPCFPV